MTKFLSPHEQEVAQKAEKKQRRRAVLSIAFVFIMLAIQTATILRNFTWGTLLNVLLSLTVIGLFIYSFIKTTKVGIVGVLRSKSFLIINTWLLLAYIVALLIVDKIFN